MEGPTEPRPGPAMISVGVPEKARQMAALMADEGVRARVADAIAARMYGVNATFPEPATGAELRALPMVADLFEMLENNLTHVGQVSHYINPAFIGIRGFGKTKLPQQFIEVLSDLFEQAGLLRIEVVACPMQLFSMDSQSVPMRGTLPDGTPVADTMLVGALGRPGTLKVVLADEIVRGSRSAWNAMLGLTTTGLVAGVEVEGFLGVIGTGNRSREDGAVRFPDYALTRRFRTRFVDSASGPFFRHLADLQPELDLRPLMEWYYGPKVTETMRESLNARTLAKILWARRLGNPLVTALPILGSGRATIEREASTGDTRGGRPAREDVTTETLLRVARLINAAAYLPSADPGRGLVERTVDQALDHGLSVVMYGESGSGKTSVVQARIRERGFVPYTFSAADSDPENLLIMAADQVRHAVDLLPVRGLVEHHGYVLVIEEVNRGTSKQVLDRIMEITGERTLGGIRLPIHAIIALGNRNVVAGTSLTHDVRQMDHAQADRFHLSIELAPGDIDAHTWLRAVFGEDADTVLGWYDEDLPEQVRGSVITPDVVRNLSAVLAAGGRTEADLRRALVADWARGTYLGEQYLPRLVARLSDARVPRLSDLVRQAQCPGGCDHGLSTGRRHCDLPPDRAGFVCRLGHGTAQLRDHGLLSAALQTASLDVIRANRAALLPMLDRLEPQSVMPLVLWHERDRRELIQDLVLSARELVGAAS